MKKTLFNSFSLLLLFYPAQQYADSTKALQLSSAGVAGFTVPCTTGIAVRRYEPANSSSIAPANDGGHGLKYFAV
jgi:hypothetical protein